MLFFFIILFLDMQVIGHWMVNGQDKLLRLVMINQSISQTNN